VVKSPFIDQKSSVHIYARKNEGEEQTTKRRENDIIRDIITSIHPVTKRKNRDNISNRRK